jgi:hypothetical protein
MLPRVRISPISRSKSEPEHSKSEPERSNHGSA